MVPVVVLVVPVVELVVPGVIELVELEAILDEAMEATVVWACQWATVGEWICLIAMGEWAAGL